MLSGIVDTPYELLEDTCSIEKSIAIEDASLKNVPAWIPVYDNVPCRLGEEIGDRDRRDDNMRTLREVLMLYPFEYKLFVGYRVIWNGIHWIIRTPPANRDAVGCLNSVMLEKEGLETNV